MKVFITPAKSIDENIYDYPKPKSKPFFIEEAEDIVKELNSLSVSQLKNVLKVSDNLAALNHTRYANWVESQAKKYSAIEMFSGDVYQQLDEQYYSKTQRQLLQQSTFIVSGLYGLLRPYDLVSPYRLEMGTKLFEDRSIKMSDYWSIKIADHLNKNLQSDEVILSLLSAEYHAALDEEKIKNKIIAVDFKQLHKGKIKTIGIFAKKARGQMLEYLVQNQTFDLKTVKGFDVDGYKLSTEDESTLVFVKK